MVEVPGQGERCPAVSPGPIVNALIVTMCSGKGAVEKIRRPANKKGRALHPAFPRPPLE
jgi:hypothetical protein